MKRILSFALVFGLAAAVVASQIRIVGQGGYSSDHDHRHSETEVAAFRFDVEGSTTFRGSLLYAAEGGSHRYPDRLVRLEQIDTAHVGAAWGWFSGLGEFNETEVRVTVFVLDASRFGKPSLFSIRCHNAEGELVMESSGFLSVGSITIERSK